MTTEDTQRLERIGTYFEEMTSGGKIVPFRLIALDRNVVRLVAYPPPKVKGRLNFRQYSEMNTVYQGGKKLQFRLFYKGEPFYGLLAPIKKDNKVIGVAAISISAKELKNKWQVTQEEFLKINFNQR